MKNNVVLKDALPPDEAHKRQFVKEYGAQVLIGTLFLVLTCFTGTLVGAFTARPHILALTLTCSILVGLCLWPSDERRGAPRFISVFWKKFERLPNSLLLPLTAWLICDALATLLSSLGPLSYEVFGSHLWVLLIASLIYSYAGRGVLQVLRIAGAMLVAIDAAVLFGVLQYISYWTNSARDTSIQAQRHAVISFLNDPNAFGHFLAMTIPLALWDVSRAHNERARLEQQTNHRSGSRRPIRFFWSTWRMARAGVMLGLSAATTSRSSWLAIVVGVAFLVYLLADRQQKLTEKRSVDFRTLLRPYRTSMIVGLVLVCGTAVQQSALFRQRMVDVVAPKDFGNAGRGVIWRNGWRLAMRRPAFGWGPGTFAVNYPQTFTAKAYREPVLQAHNTYLNRMIEEGGLALLFWLAFVGGIWRRGFKFYMRRPDSPHLAAKHAKQLDLVEPWMLEKGYTLLAALLAGLVAYLLCGFFVMSEQIPTMMVFFYGYLALVVSLVFNHDYRAFRKPVGQASPLARTLALLGGLAFILYVPTLWKKLQAQAIFDDSANAATAVDRVWQLREAIKLDPDQPVYWGQLGMARYAAEGKNNARSIAYLFRAAANRSPVDAVWWHNTAVLSLMAGNSSFAIRNALRATKYDQTYSYFQATLADAYELDGQLIMAAARRERARLYSQPPITNDPLASTPEGVESAYFCSVIGARYRRVVRDCEIIRPPNYKRENALGTESNIHFYAPKQASAP